MTEKSKEVLEKEIEILKKCMIDEITSGTNNYILLNIFFGALKRQSIKLHKVDDIRYNGDIEE